MTPPGPENVSKERAIVVAEQPEKSMEQVIREDGRYPQEAFQFLHEALAAAVKEIYGEDVEAGGPMHVSGEKLCHALRDLAIQKWGLLARTVLAKWNIRSTMDVGNMVYLLVQHDFMKKSEEDSIEHFRDVFDFDEAFKIGGEFELKE